jgi:hypothetical protein
VVPFYPQNKRDGGFSPSGEGGIRFIQRLRIAMENFFGIFRNSLKKKLKTKGKGNKWKIGEVRGGDASTTRKIKLV